MRLLSATLELSKGGAATAIRKIQATGTVEVFGAKHSKFTMPSVLWACAIWS